MQIARKPDPEVLHMLTASLRVWLMDVCLWLGEWLGVRLPRDMRMDLRRELARTLRDTRMLVFLLAFSRMRISVEAALPMRPGSAPPGFRRARGAGVGRGFSRGLRLRGRTLRERLLALRDVFEHLGRAVRRMLRHLHARGGAVALVLVWMRAMALAPRAAPHPVACDTS